MADMQILERLYSNSRMFDNVTLRLDALTDLFGPNNGNRVDATDTGFIMNEGCSLNTVFQTEHTTVSNVIFERAGIRFTNHQHKDSIEYVIIVNGSVSFVIDGACRTMTKGDCASIKRGSNHSCVSLEPNTVALAICVPPEKAYVVGS